MSPCFLSQLMAPTQPATGSLLLPLLPPAAAQWAANGEAQGETGGGSSHSETPPNPGWGGSHLRFTCRKASACAEQPGLRGCTGPSPSSASWCSHRLSGSAVGHQAPGTASSWGPGPALMPHNPSGHPLTKGPSPPARPCLTSEPPGAREVIGN